MPNSVIFIGIKTLINKLYRFIFSLQINDLILLLNLPCLDTLHTFYLFYLLFVLHLCITYNVSSICNGVQYTFPRLLNLIKSKEHKNKIIAIKHPINKYVFKLVKIHQKY